MSLVVLGVLDKTESLTPLGERVACMSCDPRLGKVLVLSAMFRCVLPMLCVAACLTRDPFHNSMQNRAPVRQVSDPLRSFMNFLPFWMGKGFMRITMDATAFLPSVLALF